MMTKISNLIVLLKAASFLAWVDAEAHSINKVNARAGPCPDDPNQIGYKTIADVNLDQEDEADRIFEGDPPRTPYVFSLCSPYTYSVDNVDQEALNVMLDNSIFTCGNEGNNNNNNEGQCVLEGAGHQVVVPPRMTVTFQGITFADFTGSSTEAGADAKVIFNDVVWTGLEDSSVLVAHDSPITVEINRGRVIGNNGVDGILTVDEHGVEADVLVKSSVGTGSTSENADYTAESTRRMHVTSEHALSKLGISIFGAVTGRGKTPARVSRYLQSHTVVDPTTLNNPNSPQSRAASWIAQDAFSADLQTSDPKYAQRFALATFYFATNGDHWEQCGRESSSCATTAWLLDVDECTWYSAGCTQQGDVFEIRFPPDGNNLVGHFPAELSLLTGMKRIMASSNAIGGSLDAPLTGLSLLEILYLPANQFRGSIPDSLYSLTRLNTLSLADNAFTGTISPDIGQLTRLAKLNLGKASLSGTIPLSIVTLDASLTDLLINDNQLTGPVPAAFGQLTNLEKLQIQGNQLTGSIPSALCAQQLGTLIVDCEVQCTCCENCGSAAVAASLASSVLSLGDSSTLASYLRALPVTAPSVFDDPFSPQSLAVSWISHDSFSTGLRLSDPRLLQRYALATFYFATGGDNWEQCGRESPSCSTNPWLTDADSCTWYSLGCTQQGNVFEVRFPPNGNRLIGSLPAELSLLTGLKRLLASSNGIGGTLDAPLAGLSLLEILYLPSNQLSGSIPDSLYSLTSLNHLTLAENALTGTISPDIEQLVSLKDLFLNNNQFKGPLPGALGQLPSLEKLRIEGNQLSGSIPAAVCAQQLVTLVVDCEVQCTCCDNCGDAAVAAIDGSTGGLESFVAYLKTLPFTLSSAFDDSSSPQSRAASWAIEEDGLSASLPVRDPKLLQRYALAAFYFATGGDSWSQCGRNSAGCATSNPWLTAADECTWFSLGCSNDGVLVEIRFPSDGNRLIGPVPPDVSLLSGLKRFSAPTNAMSGSLDAFSGLSNLQTLYVSLNRFRGSIPASVYSLTSLDTLSLEQNALTGSISTLIGRLTDVSVLELGSSSLAGPIPDVSRLMHLSELNLEKTSLSGTIPESIGSLHASLTDVFLNDNRLTGPVPAAFGQLTKLETLQIQGNQLTGSIPVAFCSQNMSALVVDCDLDCSCCDSCGEVAAAAVDTSGGPGEIVIGGGPSNGPDFGHSTGFSTDRNNTGAAQSVPAAGASSPFVEYLVNLPVTAPGVFDDPISPQSRAAYWVSYEDLYSASLPITDPKLLQRYALAAFYFATGGDNWGQCGRESTSCATTSWLSDSDECTWYSLGCTQQHQIFEIRFPPDGNHLVGILPAELSLLTGLKRLLASSNSINGGLDAPLAGLSLLEILYLPSNQFSGSIPDSLYTLTNLSFLSLAENSFTGTISPDIGQLTRLAKLNLGKASLSGTIPDMIGSLDASLTDLLLNDNLLAGPVPAALGQLTNLAKLEIQGNQMTGSIPAALCAQQLGVLIVDCEVQCSCCDSCGSAAVAAVLASSVLSGGDTSSLQSYLQVHPVTAPGVFEHAHSPQSLAASWIAQDSLSVGLQLSDPKLLQRYALATFYFATGGDNWEQCGRNSAACSSNNPWLTDGDDCSWYSLACNPQGEVFEIRFPHKGNHLNGILPAELSLLTGLKWLLASSNELRGGLDAPLAGLSLLEILYLPSNQFTGSIPDAFYSLTSLNTLSLADNAFTGTISPEIRLLANLRKLDLGKTSLSGTIPNSIGSLDSTLTDLLLNDNQLTGPVPAAFGQLTNLEKLQVQGNQLTGSIPSALCAQQLGMLIVGCEVQCTCCENCGNAAVAAFLASNVLSAGDTSMLVSYLSALPVTTPGVFDDPFSPQSLAASWIAQDVFSAGLQVSDSKLLQRYALATFYFATGGENWHQCGRESPSCGATHWLTDGDACAWYSLGCTQQGDIFEIRFPPHGNRLIGSLPAELSLLTGLKRLLASSNGIGGTLDAPLAGLSLLEILYLPSNQLSGSIPDSLYSLTSLNSLTLAENALTGTMSPDIGQLVSLKDLFLNNNQFKGPLPGALGQLPSLEKLRIEGNHLSGSIPAAVCAQQLVTLVVDCEVQCTCCDNCGDAAVAAIDGSTGGLESFVAYLKTLPFTLSSAFDDSSSPQSRAASWAIEEDGLSASLPVRDPKLLQRYALAAFYFATGGDSWSQCGRNSAGCATSNPWLTAADECTWFSLGCSNDGVLVEIRFPSDGNRLIGPVPPDVSLLSGLKRFSAPTNAMSGSLDAFSGLSNLQTLYVSLNRFRGSIPASVYSLTSLDTLSLEQNALTGSISTLIGRLTDVSVLELGSSSLAGPIPDVSRLMHLSELNLEKTSLSGTIPESIGSLHASLTDVFLNDNRLTGPVPAAFGQLTKLETLQIQGNQLTGTIPVAFCSQNMSALVVDCDLDCSCCDSCGQPEQATAGIVVVVAGPSNGVGQAASAGASPLVQYLETLPVTAPGVFNDPNSPQSLAASWITDEDLYSAGLPTTDPKLLQRYALATFYFATNGDNWEFCGRESLSCTATTWLTDEDECTWFSLGCTNQGVVWEVRFPANGNRINGPIPAELSLLTGLKRFLASSNAMGGSLDALAGLSLLEILYLPSNQFRGSLPDSLYSLTSLKTVSLAQNGLTGSISPQIGQLTDLGVLELGSSTLAGPIPTEMFQLVHLKELNVERAFLTGTIPESIRLLNASLTDLLLNNNGLTGPLPQGLDHLTALEKLEIQGNQLTGTISAAVCAQRGSLAQELSTLMVDCEVECSCCDNANCAS